MRRALVVAHPDDESLWFGGLLIREPGDWTIVCCSIPRADPVRAVKFHAACAVLGARSELIAVTEPPAHEALAAFIGYDLSRFDEIVTHSAPGEYGHRHHRDVRAYIEARWPEKMVCGCYGTAPGPRRIELTPDEYDVKLAALRCYDHVSHLDGKPKWQALLGRYGVQFDLSVETYDR